MSTFLYILYAVVAFGILIFFHELGHFLMAKIMGVRVLTFALGFGTKLLKMTWRGTEYAVCAVPLGGYVKMMGEEPDEEVAPEDRAHAFSTQSVGRRTLIVVAGVAFNLILAVGIVWVFFWAQGESYLTTRIHEVLEGYPAAEAGLKPGDRIVAVDDHPVNRWQELLERFWLSEGNPVMISFERDGAIHTVKVQPRRETERSQYGDEIRRWKIGIAPAWEVATERFGPMGALVRAFRWTGDKSAFVLQTLGRLVQGKESLKHVGGPLLIGMMAGKQAEFGVASYFHFIAFISVILAIMNLLPIPILDGGYLLFFAIEGLSRRPVNRKVRGVAQYVGIGILACIMTWAIIRDSYRLHYVLKNRSAGTDAAEAPAGPSPAPERP